MPEPLPPPEECANCGAPIPRGAKACPQCGADERTGWRETDEPDYGALDLPESAFEEDDATSARKRNRHVNGVAWYWWAAAVAIVVLLALHWLGLL
jgi:hypothetical protein